MAKKKAAAKSKVAAKNKSDPRVKAPKLAATEQNERYAALEEERDKLAAFKKYVHERLDGMGIEKNPNGKHSEEGCRVGDRLDLLEARAKEVAKTRQERDDLVERWQRLHSEVGGSRGSPLDWDKAGRTDPVQQIVTAIKDRAIGVLNLQHAHEKLQREFQALQVEFENYKAGAPVK